jgi:hypothetical protein
MTTIEDQIIKVETKIEKVETKIEKVETKIATVERKLEGELSQDDKTYFRDEKKQLRDVEKQLRDEKFLLLARQQPQPNGKLSFCSRILVFKCCFEYSFCNSGLMNFHSVHGCRRKRSRR